MAGLRHPPRLALVVVTLTAITLGVLVIAQITPAPRSTSSQPASIVALTPAHTTPSSSAPGSTPSTSAPGPASTTPTPSGLVGCSPAGWATPTATNLTSLITQLERRHGARISLAWWDQSRHRVRSTGSLSPPVAWSTIKVPLALASIAHSSAPSDNDWAVRAALRDSDNSAADQLWSALGGTNTERSTTVESVLTRAGNPAVRVPTRRLFPPHTIAGQTLWTTADQVLFLQHLDCLQGAAIIRKHLGRVSANQRFGLAGRQGAIVKGGWGPGRSGGYTVRQFGWYTTGAGARVVVAVAVHLPQGSFATARAVLDEVCAIL